jgi:FtsP/CotA-like multicopper oxidase with cupredoxin domain
MMKPMTMKIAFLKTRLLLPVMVAVASLAATAHAAAPGITGPTFNLTAQPAFLNQPDGSSVYSWGYGCSVAPAGFAPAAIANATCPTMQVPGPTMIVTEGQTVTVNLTNNLPTPAGNTSILFPGFSVTATGGVTGLMTNEAGPGGTVQYSFVASSPGTHSYYSGTQSDLQIEMGLYGAVIVLPKTIPGNCTIGLHAANLAAEAHWGESDFRLADAAYDHPATCYDREYLFQFSEMDANIHAQALAQVTAIQLAGTCTSATAPGCSLEVPTEPYHPAYFMINGRSMPDDMDPNYDTPYPHQPYNGNPHLHPGEQVLLRIIGQGRWQHPFHEHANHVRVLARDGNLILTPDGTGLAGAPLFTTTTTPGQTIDGIFYFTGRGLNWDMYGHHAGTDTDPSAILPCTPDGNGYNTGAPTAINFWEWCQDHNKPLEVNPVGDVGSGGPVTLPNPLILTNGNWYGGSPYLGPDATTRATGPDTNLLPSNTQANPGNERGWAFMWHSHNEREITTNNVFPGGMMMMMLVDSREFVIDESN